MTRRRMHAPDPPPAPPLAADRGPPAGRPRFTVLEGLIFAGALAVAALGFFPPPGVWKFPVAAVPDWIFPAGVVLALAAAYFGRGGGGSVPVAPVTPPGPIGPGRRAGLALLVFAVALAALWALRCRKFYGDAGAITGFVTQGVLFHKREPLSPTLFLLAQRGVGDALGWAPMKTIQVVNTLAGAIGVGVLLALARRIAGPFRGPRVAAAVALLGCGALQLFAGYIENYTLPTLCMLGSLVFALDALSGRRGLAAAFGLWTLACMFHLSGIVFLPAMAWLAWRSGFAGADARRASATALRLFAVTLLPALVLYALMRHFGYHRAEESGFGGGDGRMFVPLFDKSGMSQYLFLRARHLTAIANQQLLVAPLGVLLVVAGTAAALRGGRWRAWRASPTSPISPAEPTGLGFDALFHLGLVATGFLALTVLWNPDLGALRDWDLFGPVGFYLNLCGVALLARRFGDEPRRLTALLGLVAAVDLSRALPFVLHNAGF